MCGKSNSWASEVELSLSVSLSFSVVAASPWLAACMYSGMWFCVSVKASETLFERTPLLFNVLQ